MMQMLTHEYQVMKDKTRGDAVVTVTEMIWAQARYLSPESRTDESDPGSQTGKGKSTTMHLDSHCVSTSGHAHGIIYRETKTVTVEKKDIRES